MLELIAIALLQISSLTAPDTTPVTGDTTPADTVPVLTAGEQGHGGWGGGII